MKEIYTKNLYRLTCVNWWAWVYESKAESFVPEEDIWVIGLDVNCELCAYNTTFTNESGAYIEVSLNEEWVEGGAREGVLMRSHAVSCGL